MLRFALKAHAVRSPRPVMLLLVFFIATLNLGVGYALGAKLTLSDLLALIPRRKKKGEEDLPEEAPLTAAPQEATPAAAEAPAPPPAETAKAEQAEPVDVMASLSLFREQLATASADLQQSQEDPDRFVKNASKLQEANHAYLEEADSAIQQLNQMDDTAAAATCSAVTRGAEKVAVLSGEIDGLIDSGLDSEEARAGLVGKANDIGQAAEACEAEAKQAAAPKEEPPQADTPPANADGFASIDELFDQLEAVLEESEEAATHHIAAVRVDPISGHEDDDSLISQIEQRVLQLVQDALDEGQTFAPGKPSMALLKGDEFEQATERMEEIRQQVESTTFTMPTGEVKATVTCALADAHPGDGREKVVEQINLALDESTRGGGNRTYHHDGAFPTPIGADIETLAEAATA